MVTTKMTIWDFRQASWGSIIGGVITVLAVSMLMATLGTALGFGMIEPLSNDPMAGVGTTFGIWSAVSVIVSLASGGFIAGRLAGQNGFSHGFLVWATTLICAAVLGGIAISSAVQTAGSAIGTVFSTAGTAIGQGASSLAPSIADNFEMTFDDDRDSDRSENRTARLLRDTEIDVLQPAYLRQQMRAARTDSQRALQRLRANPDNYEKIIGELLEKLKKRVDAMSAATIDRDAAVSALMRNSGIPQDEAQATVDELITDYERTLEATKQTLADAQQQLNDVQANMAALEKEARERADKAASAIALSALIAFFTMLIGAIICGVAGFVGCRYRTADEVVAARVDDNVATRIDDNIV